MTPRVAILDYGCGNLASVANAVRKVGGDVEWMSQGHYPVFTHLIIPGQGSFQSIETFRDALRLNLTAWKDRGVPILGICLGMQLMCEGSEEAPGVKGLGWIPGTCQRLKARRLPHIGWNTVRTPHLHADYYFCHSYALRQAIPLPDLLGSTQYEDGIFLSQWQRGKAWAVQFHPEKSGRAGLALLAEFLRL